MYIFNALVADDAMKGQENSVFRKIRMNMGILDTYLICMSSNNDYFDIIDCKQLKQRSYPKDDLYIMGIAKGKESAEELAVSLYYTFVGIYGSIDYKEKLLKEKDKLFRRK